MVKIALNAGAFNNGPYAYDPVPLDVLMEKASQLKFDGLELGGRDPQANLADFPTKKSIDEFKEFIRSYDLEIPSYSGDFHGLPFASRYPSILKGYWKRLEDCLRFCSDFGILNMRVDTISQPPHIPNVKYEDAWKKTVDVFKEAAEKAKDHGVVLVWEFEPGFMFNKPKSEILKLVNEVNSSHFKLLFDTCHAQLCSYVGARQRSPLEVLDGGVAEFARILKGKIGLIHLIDSDNTLHDGITSTHVPFGKGLLDFDEIMPPLVDAYGDDWWSIDLCFWPTAFEEIENSKKFVDELKLKYG